MCLHADILLFTAFAGSLLYTQMLVLPHAGVQEPNRTPFKKNSGPLLLVVKRVVIGVNRNHEALHRFS